MKLSIFIWQLRRIQDKLKKGKLTEEQADQELEDIMKRWGKTIKEKVYKDRNKLAIHLKMLDMYFVMETKDGQPLTDTWYKTAPIEEQAELLRKYVNGLQEDVGE